MDYNFKNREKKYKKPKAKWGIREDYPPPTQAHKNKSKYSRKDKHKDDW